MSFHQIIKGIKAQKIIVLGDLMLDEYIQGECNRISPEAPVPVIDVKSVYHVPGGAANTAANISSLGAKAVLIGILGPDSDAVKFKKIVKNHGVTFTPIVDNSPTTKKTRVLGDQQQIVRIDREEKRTLSPRLEKKVITQFRGQITNSNCVILSDYAKGFFSQALCNKLISIAHQNKTPVVVDPRPAHAGFYRKCDYITPNWKEAHEILGKSPGPLTEKSIKKTARDLRKKLGSNILLTLGGGGLYFLPRGKGPSISIPTESKEVFDVSGAGDTVVSAFAIGLSTHASISTSLKFANRAAGIVVGKMGTSTVRAAEIESSTDPKLLLRKDLKKWSSSLKAMGKKIVTVNGSFDMLHSGHLHILKQAKSNGDVLLVGLNSDSSVKKYKGPGRPVISQKFRAEMLLSLIFVDFVHIFNEENPIKFLKEINPHIHVNGSEYGKKCIEAKTVERGGGRVEIIRLIDNLSSSGIIKKIKSAE